MTQQNVYEQSPRFGWTLPLTSDGDLDIQDDGKLDMIGGNITYVAGTIRDTMERKVKQDFTVLFKTMLKDNIFHRNMGLDMVTIIQGKYRDHIVKAVITKCISSYAFKSIIDDIQIIRPNRSIMQWNVKIKVENIVALDYSVGF